MFDLQVLALESDMTRVMSFKTGRDAQNRVFPESGSNQPFHRPRTTAIARSGSWSSTRSAVRVSQMAYFLEKMKRPWTAREPARQVADRLRLADGGCEHSQSPPLPLVLFGHANGLLKGNRTSRPPTRPRWRTST